VVARQEVYQGYLKNHNWGQVQVLSAKVVQELVVFLRFCNLQCWSFSING
jgi:hypothetical protein